MDFDLIFLLMLFVFYFLSRLGGKKKPQQRQTPPPPTGTHRTSQNPELQDALREIREALGWPPSEEQPVETAPPPRQEVPTPPRVEEPDWTATPRKHETRQQPVRREPAASPERRVTAEEEAFAQYTGINASRAGKSRLKLPAPASPVETQAEALHPLLKRLRSAQGAREAVIYAEVFEPRWKKLKS